MSTEEGNDKDLDNEIEDIWWALPYLTKLPIERFTSDNSTLAGLMFYCSKYFYLFSVRSLFTAVGTRKTRRQFSQASIKYLIIRYSEIHLQDVEKKPHRRRHHQARINHISSSSPCFALDTVRIPQAAAEPKVKTEWRTWQKLEILSLISNKFPSTIRFDTELCASNASGIPLRESRLFWRRRIFRFWHFHRSPPRLCIRLQLRLRSIIVILWSPDLGSSSIWRSKILLIFCYIWEWIITWLRERSRIFRRGRQVSWEGKLFNLLEESLISLKTIMFQSVRIWDDFPQIFKTCKTVR